MRLMADVVIRLVFKHAVANVTVPPLLKRSHSGNMHCSEVIDVLATRSRMADWRRVCRKWRLASGS